jgi:XTP/dITP diphosphohydrolase
MDIRFLSSNKFKIAEVKAILEPVGVSIVAAPKEINELQTEDVEVLVRDKVIRAFEAVGRPVFVEHTGLQLPGFNDLPGGLTRIFWDRLQADAFVALVDGLRCRDVIARTTIGYCDARRIHFFQGTVRGVVATSPAGSRDFQWDCIFVPEGHSATFAEMGMEEKNKISMRRQALNEFADFLSRR